MKAYHEQDYYDLLEVAKDASQDEIEMAYRRLKGVFGESASATFMLFGDDEAAAMRDMLEEAFSTLSNTVSRIQYDDRLGLRTNLSDLATSAVVPSQGTATSSTSPITEAEIIDESRDEPEPMRTESIRTESIRTESVRAEREPPPMRPEPMAAEPTPPPQLPAMVESPPADPLSDNMEFSGGVLARMRENRGITLEAIASRTKISLSHLRAIESNLYDKLPARVYVRGFVTQYAKFLALPADRVADSYLQIYDRFFQSRS